MKRLFLSIFAFLSILSAALCLGDSVVKEFRAEPGMNKVYLAWKVSLESDIGGYKVLRGFAATELRNLEFVASTPEIVPPGGTKSYSFIDQSVFKNDGRSYYYQIVVANSQGETITTTEIREVSPQISAVRHTWGSIKAMFR